MLFAKSIRLKTIRIPRKGGTMPILIMTPRNLEKPAIGILWIHGGGYATGMKEMALFSRARRLVAEYGAVVISPGYRLSFMASYPAAIDDCYSALIYMKEHAEELNIDPDKIMAGGESAGGGLCAALCIMARDRGEVKIVYQMPLYPMLDNLDTDSSRDNHGRVWNTRRNHKAWKMYLREDAKKNVSPYAAPARAKDLRGLPPAYTFVADGEPFYRETLEYIEKLRSAGVEADVDVYPGNMHAFDLWCPGKEPAKSAIRRFYQHFADMAERLNAR